MQAKVKHTVQGTKSINRYSKNYDKYYVKSYNFKF